AVVQHGNAPERPHQGHVLRPGVGTTVEPFLGLVRTVVVGVHVDRVVGGVVGPGVGVHAVLEGVAGTAEVHVHAHVDDVHAGELRVVGFVVVVAVEGGVLTGGLVVGAHVLFGLVLFGCGDLGVLVVLEPFLPVQDRRRVGDRSTVPAVVHYCSECAGDVERPARCLAVLEHRVVLGFGQKVAVPRQPGDVHGRVLPKPADTRVAVVLVGPRQVLRHGLGLG